MLLPRRVATLPLGLGLLFLGCIGFNLRLSELIFGRRNDVVLRETVIVHEPDATAQLLLRDPTEDPALPPPPPPAPVKPPVPRDPTAGPGWIADGSWVSADPEAPMHGFYDRMVKREEAEDLEWARNKTILFLGDSVVRDMIWTWCDVLHEQRELVQLDEQVKNEKTTGWLCVHPTYNLRMINGFIYGMTNYSRPSAQGVISGEWPPGPWGFEDRLPELSKQYASFEPDMIIFNSGAWDFKFMFRRDLQAGLKTIDIEPSELREYGERLREYFRQLREVFPIQKLLWVNMHPMSPEDLAARWFWARGLVTGLDFTGPPQEHASFPHLFTRRRVAQLAARYRQVALEEGMDDVDYWKISEAVEPGQFIRAGDTVHPAREPSIRVITGMILEKLFRWAEYGV